MKKIAICSLFLLVGCAPIQLTVYGGSGEAYVAPDLCAAILACQKAGESSCLYDDIKTVSVNGDTSTNFCHVLKNIKEK